MSIERQQGGRWRVRWREAGRNRSRGFDRKRDAQAWDAEVRRRRQLGALATLDAGGDTLDEYIAGTWAPSHAALLAPKTRKVYAGLYDCHIGPRLGHVALRDLTPDMIGAWQADLAKAKAGPVAASRAMTLLGAILQRAAESGRIASNPQRLVRKARLPRRQEVRPLPPRDVEAIRQAMLDRGTVRGRRDAALVSILAYAGLRPQEARILTWGDVRDATLLVRAPKTHSARTVRLLGPLRGDLEEWRRQARAAGMSVALAAPVVPGDGGEQWTEDGYKCWSRREWPAALKRAKVARCRVYDLRHSFASLLLHEGRSVIYVARQLGHGAGLTMGTYGHVIEELEDRPQLPAEDAIRAARGEHVPSEYLRGSAPARPQAA